MIRFLSEFPFVLAQTNVDTSDAKSFVNTGAIIVLSGVVFFVVIAFFLGSTIKKLRSEQSMTWLGMSLLIAAIGVPLFLGILKGLAIIWP